jgi:hypothetical protein
LHCIERPLIQFQRFNEISKSACRNEHGGEPVSQSISEKGMVLNRREALMLSATAGIGAAMAGPARAMDNSKGAARQDSGSCSTPRSAVTKTKY